MTAHSAAWPVVKQLAHDETLARSRGSLLGRYWSIVWPLVETAFFAVLFGALLRARGRPLDYVVFVYTGVFAWRVISRAIMGAASCIAASRALLVTMPVRLRDVILGSILATLREAAPGAALLVLVVVAVPRSGPWAGGLLWLGIGVALLGSTTVGLSLVCAVASTLSADVHRTVPPLLTLGMFAAPVAYPSTVVPAAWRLLYLCNPVAAGLSALRFGLYGGAPPPVRACLGAAVLAAGVLATGWLLAHGCEQRVRESLS